MRRRPKRGPNVSESTGKIGQELPQDQRRPLRPEYPESMTQHEHGDAQPPAVQVNDAPALQPESALPESPGHTPRDVARPRRGRPDTRPDRPRQAVAKAATYSPEPETADPESAAPDITEIESPGPLEPLDAPVADGEGSPAEGKLVVETQPELLSTPPPEASAARSHRGYVVLTIGLPGSGKTTWFKRRGVTPLSSDLLRNILFDDITEQRYQGLVFSTLRSLLRARLIAKMPWNYVDATNLSPHERRQWIKMAKSFGYDVQAVFFDVPFEVCMERNRKRERTVNDEIMQKMNERLRPPSFKEGFSKITVVRVKGAAVPDAVGAPADAV